MIAQILLISYLKVGQRKNANVQEEQKDATFLRKMDNSMTGILKDKVILIK